MPRVGELNQEDAALDRERLKEEKKKLKNEKKEQRKAAKAKARELANQEEELMEESGGAGSGSVFLVTFIIVLIWVAILCLIIKLDFGGFGSNVLTPILKDVPVLNKILPNTMEESLESGEEETYGGYKSLQEAVDYIKELELELERAQSAQNSSSEEVEQLKAEVERLKTFEDSQVEFQRIKTEFYEEVVYADNGPGIEEYRRYYEEMDPATAEYLYKQVITQIEESDEIKDYAAAYSAMKPKAAAAIFESMTDNLDLAVRILGVMDADQRGKILGAMDTEIAARITKLMDPES
jgi:flagellar motility protein MotE (MotC chaperone)